MNERVMQFRVGAMVLSAILVTVILVLVFSDANSRIRGNETIFVRFREAPGVTSDTPVRKSGILIGRVKAVDFSEDDRWVIVAICLNPGRQVYRNEVCRVNSSMLTGDSNLEFVPTGAPGGAHTPVVPGETIEGAASQDTMRAVANLQRDLARSMASLETTSAKFNGVLDNMGRILATNEQRINKIVIEADETLQTVRKTFNSANEVVGDPKVRDDLKTAAAELPMVLKQTRETVERLNHSVGSVETNLRNMEAFTRPLGERGESIVTRMDQGLEKFNRAMEEMSTFTQAMNRPDGSLGQLMNNPELYQHINRAAKNIDQLSREMKPIMSDLRVFSDKVARHPEVLGVRGAIQKNPGIK